MAVIKLDPREMKKPDVKQSSKDFSLSTNRNIIHDGNQTLFGAWGNEAN